MAQLAPFRGIRFNPKAGDPSKLLAPPYDVISDEERVKLAALDPHNCVRLILPVAEKGEKDPDARYARAAGDYNQWLADGTLTRDPVPAVYRYHQIFDVYGSPVTRRGFIARIKLEPFSAGIVLPHERTLAGPKLDRLKLMRATHAHFSQIFGLFKDPWRRTDQLFDPAETHAPDMEGTTTDGVLHRLWRVEDRATHKQLLDFMHDQKVYIADGHHRYETMLALSAELRKAAGDQTLPERSAVDYGVMFFCNMDDPGLVVLPTHRVLHSLPSFDREGLLRAAGEFFKVHRGPMASPQVVRQALAGHSKRRPTFAMLTPGAETVAYLQLRGDLVKESVPQLAESRVLAELDVTLLHALFLESLLKIDRAAQEKQTNLRYVKDWDQAFLELERPDVQAVFLMNPTRVEQVKAVADEGQVMPQKSTFFHPKIASGIVINPIDPAEEVESVE